MNDRVYVEPTGHPQRLWDGRVAAPGSPVEVTRDEAQTLVSRGGWSVVPSPAAAPAVVDDVEK